MAQEIYFEQTFSARKSLLWWLYVFHTCSLLFSLGTLSFLPLIINYIRRDDTAGTFLYSHHRWQIRSFWWYLFWMTTGGLLFITIIGIPLAMLVWLCAWVWKAYRLIRGFLDLQDNKAMPG